METVAIVVLEEAAEKIRGAVPIFVTQDEGEREKIAVFLAKILKAMIHDLENGMYVLVRH